MFIPTPYRMVDMSAKHHFINEFGFGVIISDSLTGTHLPFVLHSDEGKFGVLYAHCAKANPHWKEFDGTQVLIIFSGPHSYISPTWYAHSPAVPTWNYTAVHAYGTVSLLDDDATIATVEEVTQKYEPDLLVKRDIVTHAFRDKLLSGIVGFKIVLSKVEGQLKLGQQRSKDDQEGVYNALLNSNDLGNIALANYMEKI